MIDPKIRQQILAGNDLDMAAALERAEHDKIAAGTMLALSNLPVFELVTIGGRVTQADVVEGVVTLRMQGIGSARAYAVRLPLEYLRQIITAADEADDEPVEPDPATSDLPPLRDALAADRAELEPAGPVAVAVTTCPTCGGDGGDLDDSSKPCDECDGAGHVPLDPPA